MNSDDSQSYYGRAKEILDKYSLPSLQNLKLELNTKEQWKKQVKNAVNIYWTQNLQENARERSTLSNLNVAALCIGKVHNVWSSLESTVSDVRKGIIKCRQLTGTYLFQLNKSKFSRSESSATCRCCGCNTEDITHMLLYCSSLFNQKKQLYLNLKASVISYIGENQWKSQFSNAQNIVKLLLDISWLDNLNRKDWHKTLQRMSTNLCYKLHTKQLLKSVGCT